MSEIVQRIHQQLAECDRLFPEDPFEKRRLQVAEERERQARKTREAEEKQRASTNWYATIDERINAHLKNWLWGAIDDRIREHIKNRAQTPSRRYRRRVGTIPRPVAKGVKHGIEEALDVVAAKFATMPGKLPPVKTWRPESVSYQGEVVYHDSSLWQARKDTAQAPAASASDWICAARAGRDAPTLNFKGTLNAHEKYVVELDGSSFVALDDDPGLPGDPGWQVLSKRGNRGSAGDVGPRGRKGERGARGEATPTIVSWVLDRKNYRAVPTMSNGTQGAMLELRGLFEQFIMETGGISTGN